MARLADVYNPKKGDYYKQFWFSPEGTFLANRARNVFVRPLSTGARVKRWKRYYDIAYPEGTEIVRYVQTGRSRYWEVHKFLPDGTIWRVSRERGVPPWMQREKSDDTQATT